MQGKHFCSCAQAADCAKSRDRAGRHLILHLVQARHHDHLPCGIDRADQLPCSKLSSRSEARLNGTEDETDCKRGSSTHHLQVTACAGATQGALLCPAALVSM